jgi:hypothetical protein
MALKYQPLYRALNLSPSQVARFEAVLSEAQQGMVDLWAVASTTPGLATEAGSKGATSITRLTSEPLALRDASLKELLGEAGFKEYRKFEDGGTSRKLVGSLAANLYSSTTPLTREQGEAVEHLLLANSKKIKTAMTPDGQNNPIYLIEDSTDWNAVGSQAAAILTPEQLGVLRNLGAQQKAETEIRYAAEKRGVR